MPRRRSVVLGFSRVSGAWDFRMRAVRADFGFLLGGEERRVSGRGSFEGGVLEVELGMGSIQGHCVDGGLTFGGALLWWLKEGIGDCGH